MVRQPLPFRPAARQADDPEGAARGEPQLGGKGELAATFQGETVQHRRHKLMDRRLARHGQADGLQGRLHQHRQPLGAEPAGHLFQQGRVDDRRVAVELQGLQAGRAAGGGVEGAGSRGLFHHRQRVVGEGPQTRGRDDQAVRRGPPLAPAPSSQPASVVREMQKLPLGSG